VWRVHTWDRTVDGARTYRLDRMRSATLTDEPFEPREGFDPNYLRNPRVALVLHSAAVARWKLERGARLLTDGSALQDLSYKSEDWLLTEILGDRGETVVLEPARLRETIAKRAHKLQRELLPAPARR
jgi:proteasome accessory factor BC